MGDPEVYEKTVSIEISGCGFKFFIEHEGKFYQFDESTWSEKANSDLFEDVYASGYYSRKEFLIKIVRQMPSKITSFDKFGDDDDDEDDDTSL